MSKEIKRVYACINRSQPGKHTQGSFSYGNLAGWSWGEAYRPKVCEFCGSHVTVANNAAHLKSVIKRELEYREREGRAEELLATIPGFERTEEWDDQYGHLYEDVFEQIGKIRRGEA